MNRSSYMYPRTRKQIGAALAVVIFTVVVITGWLAGTDAQAQTVGVVFPAGAVFSDSNALTVPIVETDPAKINSGIADWGHYDR